MIGQNVDLTYPYNYLGEGAADLGEALKDEEFMKSFKEAKFPVVLVGPGILHRQDRDTILQQVSPKCRTDGMYLWQLHVCGVYVVSRRHTTGCFENKHFVVLSGPDILQRAGQGHFILHQGGKVLHCECLQHLCIAYGCSISVLHVTQA